MGNNPSKLQTAEQDREHQPSPRAPFGKKMSLRKLSFVPSSKVSIATPTGSSPKSIESKDPQQPFEETDSAANTTKEVYQAPLLATKLVEIPESPVSLSDTSSSAGTDASKQDALDVSTPQTSQDTFPSSPIVSSISSSRPISSSASSFLRSPTHFPRRPVVPGPVPIPPLLPVHFGCYQKHQKMLCSFNSQHPVGCMVCRVDDQEVRWKCIFCCLRICRKCMDLLTKIEGKNLQALVQKIGSKENYNERGALRDQDNVTKCSVGVAISQPAESILA